MLWHLDKKDLHNEFVKFAKKRGNLIHFYNTKNKPGNNRKKYHCLVFVFLKACFGYNDEYFNMIASILKL